MTVYADFGFYCDTFHGSAINEEDFPRLVLRASAVIDQRTFGWAERVFNTEQPANTVLAIRMAACAVADEIKGYEASGEQDGITSERVGNHSVTYGEKSKMTKTIDEKMADAVELYLANTGLLCRWA